MSTFLRRLSFLVLLAALPACASTGGPETGEMRRSGDSNRLTRDDVVSTHTTDAFEAIRILRPNWLRKRGAMSVTQGSDIQVYLDNVQIGGLEALRSIPTNSIGALQFMDASSATQRWGTGHVHGAILVTTISRGTREEVASAASPTHIGGGRGGSAAAGG